MFQEDASSIDRSWNLLSYYLRIIVHILHSSHLLVFLLSIRIVYVQPSMAKIWMSKVSNFFEKVFLPVFIIDIVPYQQHLCQLV